jgi:hypothetical protein
MTATPLYTYHMSGRRAVTVFALGVGAAMLGIGVGYNAPWYFFAPVGLAVAMLVWAIVYNPQSGCVLSADRLFFHNRGKEETLYFADTASITVRSWSDGPDEVSFHLKSGRVVHVPSLCADSKLAAALRDLAIVEISNR